MAVESSLGLLIFATFAAVQLSRVRVPGRFLAALLLVNFGVVTPVVWMVTRPVAHLSDLIVPISLMLLAPCIDYVIVFTGLAGSSKERLLAATPILLVLQMIALPILVPVISGGEVSLSAGPFLRAFLLLIVLPLVLAFGVQRIPSLASRIDDGTVPIMTATLFVVASSYSGGVIAHIDVLVGAVAAFAGFAAVMIVSGLAIARAGRLPQADSIAVAFSGVSRNSLVILPIALALPAADVPPAVVVISQTMVELIVMVLMVQLFKLCVRKNID